MIKEKDINAFIEASQKLAAVIKRISKDHPGANLYLTNDALHLMKGPAHDDSNLCRPLRENVVSSMIIPGIDAGEW